MAFSWYKTVTIDHTKVPSTQTDFPVLVSVTDADLKTVGNGGYVQNSSGYDVGFYADSGLTTKLDWETERYIATTGEVVYWVRIASLSSSTDTVFYMAFGDSGISTDQSNKTGVWDTSTKLVWHLSDGTTLSATDSTSNANDGTLVNSPSAISAKIDGGATVNGSNQEITIASNASIAVCAGDFTVSIWIKTSANPSYAALFDKGIPGSGGLRDLSLFMNGGKLAYLGVGQANNAVSGSATINDDAWHKIDWTRSSSSNQIRIDGTLDVSLTLGASTDAGYTLSLGGNPSGGGSPWSGSYDEFRISSIARSSDWITTEYNNQSSPSTFESFGAMTAVGGGGGATQPPRSMHQFRMRRAA